MESVGLAVKIIHAEEESSERLLKACLMELFVVLKHLNPFLSRNLLLGETEIP